MDLKITPMQQLQQIEQAAKTNESDGSFRFTLLSTIEEQELPFYHDGGDNPAG